MGTVGFLPGTPCIQCEEMCLSLPLVAHSTAWAGISRWIFGSCIATQHMELRYARRSRFETPFDLASSSFPFSQFADITRILERLEMCPISTYVTHGVLYRLILDKPIK